MRFFKVDEGLCVQCMHIGPYDDEPATVAAMDAFVQANGYTNDLTAAGAAYTGLPLTIDGNIITGEALGAAIPFALAIARELAGADAAARVKKAIVYQ